MIYVYRERAQLTLKEILHSFMGINSVWYTEWRSPCDDRFHVSLTSGIHGVERRFDFEWWMTRDECEAVELLDACFKMAVMSMHGEVLYPDYQALTRAKEESNNR